MKRQFMKMATAPGLPFARPRVLGVPPVALDRSGTTGVPAWVQQAVRAGLATSVLVPLGVVLALLFPILKFEYPLVLVALPLAGPIAARGLDLRRAIAAASVAGVLSGVIAAGSLAIGAHLPDAGHWSLLYASTFPPMPSLPRVGLIPLTLMSWPQQDILAAQAPLAVLLAVVLHALRPLTSRTQMLSARVLPSSLSGRLTLALSLLTALTFCIGWVGFGALEDMHFRGHAQQLRAEWQRELSLVRTDFEAEQRARALGADASIPARSVDATLVSLATVRQYPGIAMGQEYVAEVARSYRPRQEALTTALAAYRSAPELVQSRHAAFDALQSLRAQVDADARTLLNADDRAHHERLMLVMVLLVLCGAGCILLGDRLIASVKEPIGLLATHLGQVSHGNFLPRVAVERPLELAALGSTINHMTADLGRLYAVERESRSEAEATAHREHDATAAKEFWTNTVVHDLKSPLSVIVGYLELLDAQLLGPLRPRQSDAVAQARLAADSLQQLVTDINDSFRLEANALMLDLAAVEPLELLRQAARAQAQPGASEPDVAVSEHLPPVQVDARLVQRLLLNLLSNSYKHAGSQAQIVLSAREVPGGMVQFSVQDNGPGIPEPDLQRVFARFAQGASSQRGSGLGLAFCKLVVEHHGGQIWAEAVETGGARLCFVLPSAPPVQDEAIAA